MSTSDSHDYELIDQLAEEFAERFRNGERPSVQEYCDKYPHVADDLRGMLPALAEVEQVKDEVQAPPAAEPPRLRQVDEYHILREVGRGGMGVVYEAEDTRLTRRVALKVLATGKAGHALERFKREARAAARLHHTNIVPVFGVGDHDGLPYYVMQFIQGLGLDEVLDEVKRLQAKSGSAVLPSAVSARPRKDISAVAVARSLITGTFEPPAAAVAETLTHVGQVADLPGSRQVGDLPHEGAVSGSSISLPGQSNLSGRKLTYWQSVAQIGLQVADALDYAHKQGILHRDIKPSNLLLDLHGVVWVTDFGLAKATDQEDLTHTGDVLGTLRYMPPEAFEGKSEARSDVYSLGLTMYELLALRPAYDERKKEQLVKQVTTTDPPRLGSLNRSIPRDLVTIVHKAIEKDPDHRYKSAADLGADLRRFLADQTILARRVGPGERFARWCKRNPTVAGLTAAVFLLVTSVAVVSSVLALRIEQKANEARAEAERANGEAHRAELARDDAALNLRLAHTLLADQFVDRGAGLLSDGDPSGAALCFTKALTLDSVDAERVASHRLRLAAALRDAPRPRHVLFHPARVVCTAVSPDGQLLAAGGDDGTVIVWDLATGAVTGPPLKHDHPVRQVAFAAGGRRLWTCLYLPAPAPQPGDDPREVQRPAEPRGRLTLWDRATGDKVVTGSTFVLPGLAGPEGGTIDRVGFMPAADTLEIRDAATGDPVGPAIRAAEPIDRWFVLSRVGRVLVLTQKGRRPFGPDSVGRPAYQAGLWDTRTGQPVLAPFEVRWSVNVAFCGAGFGRVAAIDAATGTAVQWYDAATGARAGRFEAGGPLTEGLTVSPDGRRVIAIQDDRSRGRGGQSVQVLDGDTGEPFGPAFAEGSSDPGGFRISAWVVPNRDATRLLLSDRANTTGPRLVRGDGVAVPNQPDAAAVSSATPFSPDGGFLLTVAGDNSVRVWDAWTGSAVTPRLPHTGPVVQAHFTPDGSHVVVVSGQGVWVWPLARTEPDRGLVLGPGINRQVYLSADGLRVLEVTAAVPFGPAAGRSTARLLDAATGQVVAGPVDLPGDGRGLSGGPAFRSQTAQISSDGRAVVLTTRPTVTKGGFKAGPKADEPEDQRVRVLLWLGPDGRLTELANLALQEGSLAPADFSPDGRFVRVQVMPQTGPFRARLFDTVTGEPAGPGVAMELTRRPKFGGFGVTAGPAQWSPDSAVVVVRALDEKGNLQLHLRDARTGAEVGPPIVLDGPRATTLLFDARGDRLLTVQPASGSLVDGPQAGPAAFGVVRLWDARTGRPLMPALTGDRLGGDVRRAALSPAGDRIAVVVAPSYRGGGPAFEDRPEGLAVHLWDPAADRPAAPPLVHDRPVGSVAFSPAGDLLATATDTRQVRLWAVATGDLRHAITTAETVTDLQFSSDGRRVVAQTGSGGAGGFSPNTHVQAWDARTGHPLTPLLRVPGTLGGRPVSGPGLQYQSRDADRFLVEREDGTRGLFTLTGDDRPAADLVALAELLSGRQVNPAGIVQGLGPAAYRTAWEGGRDRFAADWAAAPVAGPDWHRRVVAPPPTTAVFAPATGGLLTVRGDRAGQYLWHLDRLMATEPNEPRYHVLRGQAYTARGDFAAAVAAFDRGIALDPDPSAAVFQARARARAELGDWAGAEDDLVAVLARPTPTFGPAGQARPAQAWLALVRLRRGNEDGYREACAEAIRTAHGTGGGSGFNGPRQYWVALLRDGVDPDVKSVAPTTQALQTGGFTRVSFGPFQVELALRYRQGRYDEVEAALRTAGIPPTAADDYFLAMAQHRQGKPEAAKTLAKANDLRAQGRTGRPPDPALGSGGSLFSGWQVRIVEDVLQKEAEGLIGGKK
jgi:serine/threonine protein kinase/WD40 repeat protein/tetratricopeptide (TPR) repeat protein